MNRSSTRRASWPTAATSTSRRFPRSCPPTRSAASPTSSPSSRASPPRIASSIRCSRPEPPGTQRVPFASSWGHLDLIEVVGRGSYGTVYRAWDPRLDRLVALKLFHGARNPEAVMREGRMLARIRHENVVTVYGADVYNGIAGIWMEFVHGRRLDQIVEQQGPLSAEEATLVGLAVCRALVAVHARRPSALRRQGAERHPRAGGRIVLMDLGAGRSSERRTRTARRSCRWRARRATWRPRSSTGAARCRRATCTASACCCSTWSADAFRSSGETLSEIRKSHLAGQRVRLDDVRADLPAQFVRDVTRALDPDSGRAARHGRRSSRRGCSACRPLRRRRRCRCRDEVSSGSRWRRCSSRR